MSSTMWGENPTLLACGHLAEPWAGFGSKEGVKVRECARCAREKGEGNRWQAVVVVAWDWATEPEETERRDR